MDYLARNTLVRPAATFVDRLPKSVRYVWDEMPPLAGYASSYEEDELAFDYKTADGDYGHAVFHPDKEPLVLEGNIIQNRDQIQDLLERYGRLQIRVKSWYMNGVVKDSCNELVRLFGEIAGIK